MTDSVSPPRPERLGLIWAEALDGAIGRDGTMPWHLPEDLAWFRACTTGTPVLMGRRTWESLPDAFRPLPGRRNIVVTRDARFAAHDAAAGAEVVTSVDDALERAGAPAWGIGGGQLYAALLPQADTVARTVIHTTVEDADTVAPKLEPSDWHCVWRSESRVSRTGLTYHFEIWKASHPHARAVD